MGVNISPLVQPNEIEIEKLAGKTLAVDAFNWIYQFITTIRQADGEPLKDSKGNITSHLSGLFYRNMKLLNQNIRLIYVFDGKPPEEKNVVRELRRDVRKEAEEERKQAIERGDYEAARKFAQRSSFIDKQIIEESKDLLFHMGVPVVQAPSEGEAECAHLCIEKKAWAVASQDFDSLLFGTPVLIRSLSYSGKPIEMIELHKVLDQNQLNHDQLISIGVLVGTDYNPGGIKGIGPKKALKLIKQKPFKEILKEVQWDFDVDAKHIFEMFKHPNVGDAEIKFSGPDIEKIKNLLCSKHDFSEDDFCPAFGRAEKAGQKSLSRFFG